MDDLSGVKPSAERPMDRRILKRVPAQDEAAGGGCICLPNEIRGECPVHGGPDPDDLDAFAVWVSAEASADDMVTLWIDRGTVPDEGARPGIEMAASQAREVAADLLARASEVAPEVEDG